MRRSLSRARARTKRDELTLSNCSRPPQRPTPALSLLQGEQEPSLISTLVRLALPLLVDGVRAHAPPLVSQFSRSPQDSVFTAVLYVSDSDKIYRYTDEGPIEELCRWSVDLSALPSWARAAESATGSFWVEFDLGLVMDSAEIHGVLLTDEGEEVGRAHFEYLGN